MEPESLTDHQHPELILASTSLYRRELLTRLQLPFATASPNVDETPVTGESAKQCAMRLARLKARAVAAKFPAALIIGSDQVAECEGQRLDKPGSRKLAAEQLTWTSGKQAIFNTAVTLFNAAANREQSLVVPTVVRYRKIAASDIERYLDKEAAFDCAGSAKAESLGISLLEAIEGSDPTALIGLPLIALCAMLRTEHVNIP